MNIGMPNKQNNTTDTVNTLASNIICAMQDIKGHGVTSINLEKLESAPASRFVICQANSITQTGAIADSITDKIRKNLHIKPYSIDGTRNGQWIVIDYGSVIAHVFLREVRELYNLEELWSDADIENLPDQD